MPKADALARELLGRITPAVERAFRGRLLDWFEGARRPMPWRETGPDGRRDPYRVWISEIMLQQTRVETATPYFLRFVEAFPDVAALAAAPQDRVLKLWEGLGYYSRARNLHRAAQQIVSEHGGVFPRAPEAVRALPGVGPYTSAAVLSLAFGHPAAVLDGNVIRVLGRVLAVEADSRKPATRKALQAVADALLTADRPGDFNEAVMELGATVCTPRAPACGRCPLREVCAARAAGAPEAFPVVSKRAPTPHVDVAVGVVLDDAGRVLIQKRPESAMLGGLWEFPGGKVEPGETPEAACRRELREETGLDVEIAAPLARVDHAYSHFKVTLHAFRCRHLGGTPRHESGEPIRWVARAELDTYAFPTANRKILDRLADDARAPTLF